MTKETGPSQQPLEGAKETERFLDNIVLEHRVVDRKVDEYVSSGQKGVRKSVRLSKNASIKPEPGRPYRVRILEDKKPGKIDEGFYIVEVSLDQSERDERASKVLGEIKELLAEDKFEEANKLADQLNAIYEPEKAAPAKTETPKEAPDPEALKAWRGDLDAELGEIKGKVS